MYVLLFYAAAGTCIIFVPIVKRSFNFQEESFNTQTARWRLFLPSSTDELVGWALRTYGFFRRNSNKKIQLSSVLLSRLCKADVLCAVFHLYKKVWKILSDFLWKECDLFQFDLVGLINDKDYFKINRWIWMVRPYELKSVWVGKLWEKWGGKKWPSTPLET